MLDSFNSSISSGTASNRETQAKAYIKFALSYHVPLLHPSVTQACMYLQFLSNSFAAPTTVKNYVSGARTWIVEHGGNVDAFASQVFLQLSRGTSKRSQHVPNRAEPLLWEHVRHIIDFINITPSIPLSAKPCILIGFHTFLRSSNLLTPSTGLWAGPHTMLAKHLKISDRGLHVSVITTKTKFDPVPITTILPWNNDPVYCPVQAWLRYVTARRPCPVGPAFVTDEHRPLTPRIIVGIMRLALQSYPGVNVEKVSLHSLRRGAAQNAKNSGASVENIMQRGMWRSRSGLAPYLK